MVMNKNISNIIKASIDVKKQILENTELLATIEKVGEVIVNAFKNGNRVYFCGNGGSAAEAQHLAAEFSGRFYTDRKALPADALDWKTFYVTAVAKDGGYGVGLSWLLYADGQV